MNKPMLGIGGGGDWGALSPWGNQERIPSSISNNLRIPESEQTRGRDGEEPVWEPVCSMTNRIGIMSFPEPSLGETPKMPRDLGSVKPSGLGSPRYCGSQRLRRSCRTSCLQKKPEQKQGLPFWAGRNILERDLPFGKLPTQSGVF